MLAIDFLETPGHQTGPVAGLRKERFLKLEAIKEVEGPLGPKATTWATLPGPESDLKTVVDSR